MCLRFFKAHGAAKVARHGLELQNFTSPMTGIQLSALLATGPQERYQRTGCRPFRSATIRHQVYTLGDGLLTFPATPPRAGDGAYIHPPFILARPAYRFACSRRGGAEEAPEHLAGY